MCNVIRTVRRKRAEAFDFTDLGTQQKFLVGFHDQFSGVARGFYKKQGRGAIYVRHPRPYDPPLPATISVRGERSLEGLPIGYVTPAEIESSPPLDHKLLDMLSRYDPMSQMVVVILDHEGGVHYHRLRLGGVDPANN